MQLTKGEKQVLCRAIALTCENCDFQVPVREFRPEDKNLYHHGIFTKCGHSYDILMTPCSAYRMRRDFDFLGLVSEADA